ncbi:DUF882 domain-containing protein [Martelella sp. HB161492]|uniref:DUF882 domain-containing protein n=1 Tax=Martelella sp. HB161492 TaxID=2720726 RepID=UPI001FEE32E4|nr:DUF882 domain-containing protein [Martelella sp. HB161492]
MLIRNFFATHARLLAIVMIALACLCSFGTAGARAETRTLKLYYIHTGEKAEITFKRNGRYDKKGLEQLNWFLRDWRHNEPTKMDPRLFDLVWEVYQKVGAKDYINVVSAYRSPATNSMLRKTTVGVAKNSQHMQGKAMDFFIPGIPLKTLRATAMKMQDGGVGYYPTSGSPFVHLDVASVRAWPRMSRSELVQLFPNGHTLHLPADGKPLPGYAEALAEYKAKGSVSTPGAVLVASADDGDEDESPSLIARLFSRGSKNEPAAPQSRPQPAAAVAAQPAPAAPAPDPVEVLTASVSFDGIDVPVPQARPGSVEAATGSALALVDPSPSETAPAVAALAAVPLPAGRPAGLEADSGTPIDAAATVEVASLDEGEAAADAAIISGGDAVPLPSPRAGDAAGTAINPTATAVFAEAENVPMPVRDPRVAVRTALAKQLESVDTIAVANAEPDDFRSVFQPDVALAALQRGKVSVDRGGRVSDVDYAVVTVEKPVAPAKRQLFGPARAQAAVVLESGHVPHRSPSVTNFDSGRF